MDASATLSSPAIIRWINDPEVKVSADTQALCSVGEKAFIVFEQEAGSSKGDSWMEIEYAIFFHLAKSCPWAVPGLNFFFPLAISALSGPPTSLPFFPENYLQNWFPLLQTNIMGTWGGKKILGCDELGLSGASKSPLFLFYCLLGSLFFQQLGIMPLPTQSPWSMATFTGYGHHRLSSLCCPCSPSQWANSHCYQTALALHTRTQLILWRHCMSHTAGDQGPTAQAQVC